MVSYSASQCASCYRLLITIPQFSPILVHPLSGEYLQSMAMSVGIFEKEKVPNERSHWYLIFRLSGEHFKNETDYYD